MSNDEITKQYETINFDLSKTVTYANIPIDFKSALFLIGIVCFRCDNFRDFVLLKRCFVRLICMSIVYKLFLNLNLIHI